MSDTRRLRVAHLIVQPVLVWDDGEDLEPGPGAEPVAVPLRGMDQFLARLMSEVDAAGGQTPGPTSSMAAS